MTSKIAETPPKPQISNTPKEWIDKEREKQDLATETTTITLLIKGCDPYLQFLLILPIISPTNKKRQSSFIPFLMIH